MKLLNEFEKCALFFMESLIADFIQFFSAMSALDFVISLKFPHFLTRLTTREVTRTFSL